MALPMNSAPKYPLTLPSTGEEYYYKPFVVKQEKALMIAMQSEDHNVMLETLKGVINDCFDGKLDVEKLATFDVEYIFMNIRGKSVGEKLELTLRCKQCDPEDKKARVKIETDVSEIKIIKNPEHEQKIELFDDVGVKMKYPTLEMVKRLEKADSNKNDPDALTEVIKSCMDYIYNTDEVWKVEEIPAQELTQFLDNLTNDQFLKIQKFFETMPKLAKDFDYTCPVCGTENHQRLEGLQGFFM